VASAAKPVLSPSPLDLLLLGNTEESFYLIVKIPAACSPQTSTMLMNLAATRGTPYRKVVTFALKRPAESEGWPVGQGAQRTTAGYEAPVRLRICRRGPVRPQSARS
jgi:hypothetical protein